MLKKTAIALIVLLLCTAAFLISAYVAGTIASPEPEVSVDLKTEADKPLETFASTSSTVEIATPKSDENAGTVIVGGVQYEAAVQTGKTAHDLMEAARVKGLSFETEYFSGLGFFVTSIGGIKNDPGGGRYWTLYVNGERSNLGASNYILKSGDVIEWKLEKN